MFSLGLISFLFIICNMPKSNILIIDDEDKLRGLLARIVSLEGYTVTEAASYKSGLKKLESDEFAVVICDVKLPDGNGIELTQKIKSLYPFTEVLVLTAHGTIADGVQAIKQGAFGDCHWYVSWCV